MSVSLDSVKFAAYFDEAGDDPASSISTLSSNNIYYTILRNIYNDKPIVDLDDNNMKSIRSQLIDSDISVVSLSTNLGCVDVNDIDSICDDEIIRVFNVAKFFKVESIKVYCGIGGYDAVIINRWMNRITDFSIQYNLVPVLEIDDKSSLVNPDDAVTVLNKYRRWKLLYDPAQFLVNRKCDPISKYWRRLSKYVYAIDLRDFKTSRGPKPIGYGDTMILDTFKSALENNGNCWCFFEPSLGRRFSGSRTKSESFNQALEIFKNQIDGITL